MPWVQVAPVINHKMRDWCSRPYPGHPKGCPNVGKYPACPPQAPLFDEIYDLSQPVFAVYNIFDMAGHLTRMRIAHPAWSERQLRCCLYWQAGARKELREWMIPIFIEKHRGQGFSIAYTPEAMGVNIHSTMARAGIYLEWPPKTVAYQIVLAVKISSKAMSQMNKDAAITCRAHGLEISEKLFEED